MNKIRNDIIWFKNNSDIVYLDSAATSLKPFSVLEATRKYFDFDCTNPHNTDSSFSFKTQVVIDETRNLLAEYLNSNVKNIVFTPGATFSLNIIALSLSSFINEGDEIILTNAEHASNILPWFDIREKNKAKIVFSETNILDSSITEKNILDKITNKTKIVAFANATNLLGTKINAEELSLKIKEINKNIIVIIDATQYLSHQKMDLKNSNIDFVVGSAHKMMGPTGIGFMFISDSLFEKIKPHIVGGGMNHTIRRDYYTLMDGPSKFEAGTLNVAGIYGWNASLKYYKNLNLEKESEKIYLLKEYLDNELSTISDITIHNKGIKSFTTIFSYKNVFSQDLAHYLGNKNIIVRSGLSCAKLADEVIDIPHVVRVSMQFYTTKEDVDKLINAMKTFKKGDELNGIV